MSAPNHYEIRTPLPLRAWSFVGALVGTNAVFIALWLAYMGHTFNAASLATRSPVDLPWWVSPIALVAIIPLIIPAFIRIYVNDRNFKRSLRTHLERRAADENAPDRRVFWRHDEPGAAKGPDFANPYWSPTVPNDTDDDDGRELRPPPRTPSRESAKRIVMITIATGASFAALYNFVGLPPAVIPVIVALLVAWGQGLKAVPAPVAGPKFEAWRTGFTLRAKRSRWEKTDLVLVGAHEQTARCLLHDRETGRLTPFHIHADDATLLAQRAANDNAPARPALTTPTVTMPTSVEFGNDAEVDTPPPPSVRRLILFVFPLTIAAVWGVTTLITMPAIMRSIGRNQALPSFSFTDAALMTLGAAIALSCAIGIPWMRSTKRRFERDMRAHTFAPASVTRAGRDPSPTTKGLRWPKAQATTRAEPVYEETVFTPDLRWYQNPLITFTAVLPAVLMLNLGGTINFIDILSTFAILAPLGIAFGLLAVPVLTLRAVKARHPRADATAIEFPGKGDAVERYEWSTSALVVLGEWAGATHLRVLDTTKGRHTDFTIPARSLPDLLGAIAAYRKDHTEKTTDDDA